MRRFGLLLAGMLLGLGIMSMAMPPVSVYAAGSANILDEACSSGNASKSPNCDTSPTDENPLTGSNGMLIKITHFIAIIAGFAAIVVIIISGMRYITSGGDTQKAVGARNALVGALVGLVIIALADVIIVAVVKGFL